MCHKVQRAMRILFVHHVSSVGGGSYCLLNVVKAVDRQSFEPVVALKEDGPLAEEMRKMGVEVVFFPEMSVIPYNMTLMSYESMAAYHAVKKSAGRFKDLLVREKIDILYLNSMMLCGYLHVAKECGCKTVLHVREHWPVDEHKCQLGWVRKQVYQYADRLIAINRYSATMFPGKPAVIIYDWINLEERYRHLPLNDIIGEDLSDKKVFLYTGGIQRIKGAYEVMKTFCRDFTSDSYRLLVLGFTKELSGHGVVGLIKSIMYSAGFPTYEYKVKMLARNDSRVVCIPYIYEIKDILDQVDCMLSYYTIPHANLSMAEAIVSGVPVIAARTEEAEEYSDGGTLANLFEMNNRAEFVKAISCFVNGGIASDGTMTAEARNRVSHMFSREKNSALLNRTLHELIS